MNLDFILDKLHKAGQRATYGAVGGVLGRPAIGIMAGRPKDKRHSWVVAKPNGLPSGFTTAEIDPRLAGSPPPLDTPESLAAWLRSQA